MGFEPNDPAPPSKAYAPAAERNRLAIGKVLESVLPGSGVVLEVASGTGQHAVHLASQMPTLTWQPSDVSPRALESTRAWADEANLQNLLPPIRLDVLEHPWPIAHADAVLCINMIHIAPWTATLALFRGARRLLGPDRVLVTYGPYRMHGSHTAPSNETFDRSLRSQHPEWGVRDIDDLVTVAHDHDFSLTETHEMPANNFTLVWRRGQDAG